MKERKNESSFRNQAAQDLLLERIREYARAHVEQKITLKDVARHCGVSVSTITQFFRKTTGDTFHSYLTQLRMEKALQLIREGVALEEAGRLVGYADHSSFYRAFCQTFGQSPRAYKRSLLQK